MLDEADADGTARPAAVRATAAITTTRLHTHGLRSQACDRPPKAVLERDLRLPAQQLAGPADLRLADLRVVLGQSLEHDLALRARHLEHDVRQLEEGELLRIAEVDRQMLGAHRE